MKKLASQSLSEYLEQLIIASGKTQMKIAEECGFEKSNIITMLKKGQTNIPLARVGAIARSLNVEPIYLYGLVMQEHYPDLWEAIEKDVFGQIVLTGDELELIKRLRAGHVDIRAHLQKDMERRSDS